MNKFLLSLGAFSVLGVALPANAQHIDVLVQNVGGKLVTGAANYDAGESGEFTVGQRVFKRQLLSNFRTNDPGFTTLETGHGNLAGGVLGLTPGIDLDFDIIPTTIDGLSANFWYWDGVDPDNDGFQLEDVSFELGAPGLEWRVLDDGGTTHAADGSDSTVPGVLVQEVFSTGAVHSHLIMLVVDNDGDAVLNRPEGIYMTSMVLQADGFETSDPFFFVHRTSGLTNEPRDIAAAWVEENYDSLVGASVPGDFDGSGSVDGADFLIWQQDSGTAGDLADWEDNYGVAAFSAPFGTVAVPEPGTLVSLVIACAASTASRRR